MKIAHKSLSEICEIVGGIPAPQNEADYDIEGFPFVKMKDLGNYHLTNNLVEVSQRVKYSFLEKHKKKVIKRGAILLPRSGSVALNHRAILGIDALIVSHICALQIKDRAVDNTYLYYALRCINMKNITKKTTGLDAITFEDLGKLIIPLPPLSEQKRIADILDKADSLRQKRKESIALLDELLKSVFIDMFGDPVRNEKGWEVRRLGEVSENIVDCPHSTPKHSSEKTDYPCIRTTELRNGYINWSSMKYVELEVYKERCRRLFPIEGDIIFGREGNFGEAIRIPSNCKICLGQRVMLFRPKSGITNSIFLWALLRSKSIMSQALRKSTGSTVSHVNVKDIINFMGICPPLSFQQTFSNIVIQIEGAKAKMTESLSALESQFKAFLQRASRGEGV